MRDPGSGDTARVAQNVISISGEALVNHPKLTAFSTCRDSS